MLLNFQRAKRVLHQNSALINIIAVNGCCYGKDSHPDKGEYLKLCGQAFWSFISGDDELYLRIIEPLGKEAKEKDDTFKEAYSRKVNLLSAQFLSEFCSEGNIHWNKLLKFVSSRSTTEQKTLL